MKLVLILLFVFVLVPGNQVSQKDIAGTWKMNKVIQSGKDVTLEHNPHNERYLILKADSSFESGGRPFGKNTGKFSFEPETNQLFLDSDTGPDDDSYWTVSFKGDTMVWKGIGSEWAKAFELIHVREK